MPAMPGPTKKQHPALPARAVYAALLRRWGPQQWWPARTRAEMIIGAILTQHTAWTNVERAIARLRRAGMLRFDRLHAAPPADVERWIQPAGTYRAKARSLRAFTARLYAEHGGSLDRLFRLPTPALRAWLLAGPGIGPETADCILLYAARRPVFVVDAYTRRLVERHGWGAPGEPYDAVARRFTDHLPASTPLFNEYHALLVQLGKAHCKARAQCEGCPLGPGGPARRGKSQISKPKSQTRRKSRGIPTFEG
jgi:endonuclease-3 related protein